MPERSIILTPEQVREFMGGASQLRLPMKPQPSPSDCLEVLYVGLPIECHVLECPETGNIIGFGVESTDRRWQCPFGSPGDTVKRAWVDRDNGAWAWFCELVPDGRTHDEFPEAK